ncbi:hypothetical protein TSUD_97550 [Trifolium subterraneum]|uniref:Transmembrane protein n=1 Tax=Trifolium subterraneum TaxID=3900 RepID=A0A2Z6LH36_TRISU|nr:hypothetical protein TSUD_97550 [Trifolium subterraneum]
MNPSNLSFIFLLFLTLLSTTKSQERAPHGLIYENPIAFPPSAYLFFHPNAKTPETKNSCITSKCSPLPMAAKVETNQKYENNEALQKGGKKQIGVGAVAGIIIVVTFVVLLAIGVYYVKVIRQSNTSRTINNVQSHA